MEFYDSYADLNRTATTGMITDMFHLCFALKFQIRYAAKLGYKKVKVMTLLYDTVL